MRLATIHHQGTETGAVRLDDAYVPLNVVGDAVPDTLLGLLRMGLDIDNRRVIMDAVRRVPTEHHVPVAGARLAPPYRDVSKLFGIGLNYQDHAADLGARNPAEPASFIKGAHTIAGPDESIHLPPQSSRTTAEAEVGLVIGRMAWQVDEETALHHVAAVVPILDQTAEDILQRDPRFLTRSKNFPTFFVFGPELTTMDEVLVDGALDHINVATWHNGALHRQAPVEAMRHNPAYLVAFHSQVMPLYPGDIISTGTPGAVVISPGDLVEARIDGLAPLRARVLGGHVPNPPLDPRD